MSLSTSRQQFLAYEQNGDPELQYGRKGGVFISTCICISFILFAVLGAVLVGVIVYFITFFKVSQKPTDFWDEMEPFGQPGPPSPDLRLPPHIVPSFYRLKLKANLEESTSSGEVYITLRANKQVKEIILHAKNLTINSNAKLTEQIYENIETIHSRRRRDLDANATNNFENNSSNIEDVTLGNSMDYNVTELPMNTTEQPVLTEAPPIVVDTQVTHSDIRNIKITSITKGTGDRLILSLATALTPNLDYTLELSFEGQILNSLTGFYKSSYTNDNNEVRQLAVTQFEPTSARAAFPCFDEPAFKAKFEISIAHHKNLTVLSNMKVATQESIPDEPSWQWTHFERSVRMSTYLVAYVLSDFVSVETSYLSKDNVTKIIKIWARPELIGKASYALSITPKLLAYYEDVFGVPYALDKLDLIAIPDFSSGAMENWGLITFRETTLLFDETESGPRDKQNVAIDVAHELAHQWFGNLVTMSWWSDLWLNEGFATYIEYLGVDKIEPEWDMFESFSRDKMELLRSDALRGTAPVARLVRDADDISQKFDEISYTKGANLIRMLNHTISERLFHEGLAIYLNKWKYQNAEENDLWAAMSTAARAAPALAGLSVERFMNSWTRQAGYPVVSVRRDYHAGHATFHQKIFTGAQEPYPSMADQLWHIPISYTVVGAGEESSTAPRLWLHERIGAEPVAINESQALYVNVDAIGYYRVNYDQRNWQLLSEALRAGQITSPISKAQLIDDAFNLAKAGQLAYSHALSLTTCLMDGEDSRTVWDMVLNNMAFLNHNLKSTPGYIYFQDYMRLLLSKQLQKLEYGLRRPRDDNEALLVESLVIWECLVESPRCLAWARDQFDQWAANDTADNPIPSYLRALVYSTAIKFGGRREFEIVWKRFLNSSDPVTQSLLLSTLPATRDESLISFLLERSLTDLPKQYASMAWGVEPPVGTGVAQQVLIEQFDRVHDKLAGIDAFSLPTALSGAFGVITTADELQILKNFALQHKQKLLPMSQTLQKMLDAGAARVRWIRAQSAHVADWFKQYVQEHAPSSSLSVSEPPRTENITVSNAEMSTSSPLDQSSTEPTPHETTTNQPLTTTNNSR